nr:VOC family protein [Microbacterium immunditiarum]
MADNAAELIEFLEYVFGAIDVPEARTLDGDGTILHSELLIGDSMITVADRKADWPFTPAFTRVYVDDVDATLERAVQRGGRIVTNPTDFWGDVFSRFVDPQQNLWWVYAHNPAPADTGDADSQTWSGTWTEPDAEPNAEPGADETWESYSSPELTYIHSTLLEAVASLRDPRR